MAISTRREFILLAGAVSVGCVARGTTASAPSDPPPVVRAPAVGQSWRYAKHDYFTGSIVDTQIDRVTKIGGSVEIESRSEAAGDKPIQYPSGASAGGTSIWAPIQIPHEPQQKYKSHGG